MNNTQIPTLHPVVPLQTTRAAAVIAATLLTAHLASAATAIWTGTSGDQLWSTSGNWSAGVPAFNDDVVFNVDNNAGSAGVVNNIVDTSRSIQSLSYLEHQRLPHHPDQRRQHVDHHGERRNRLVRRHRHRRRRNLERQCYDPGQRQSADHQ